MFRWGPAFVVLLAVSTALSGCGQVVPGRPVADPAARATTPVPTTSTSASVPLRSLAGRWTGTYRCGQGETALRLTIDPPERESAPTIFAFGPLPTNKSVPEGSFTMTAAYRGSGLTFSAGSWINRPGNYETVDLLADKVSTTRISGIVAANPGCSTFHVDRDQH